MLFKIFPCALVAFLALVLGSASALAQHADIRSKQTRPTAEVGDSTHTEDEPIIISASEVVASANEELKQGNSLITGGSLRMSRFLPLISEAIDERLGSRYRWGATVPGTFDCSGFVWATFRAAGIDFDRGSARNLWARFEAPAPEEQYKFGTLVFFNHLSHVGIVADENGFYHASRHHGVVYAPFAGYWAKHITGFRQVLLPVQALKTDE